jgi:glyoxylase-like metal-dependent hydrolase (beta-lactamase superfamily II)
VNAENPLSYEFAEKPEVGQLLDIDDGLKWLRLPLPFMLDHINVWLLQDDDGWALVDTGLFTDTTTATWKNVLSQHLGDTPLSRILVTHLHPDHIGCAGWLARKFGIDFWMTRDEYLLARVLVADIGKPAPPEGIRFYRAAGFDAESLDYYREHFGGFGRVVSPMPEAYLRLHHDQQIRTGRQQWRVIVGRGHSPEHACLFNEEQNVVISGDQILPTISSNVSVWPTEPAANPLAHWFDSLKMLKRTLPHDVLVLPAHGKPFRGAHERLDQLIEEHETGLARLRKLCREPRRAVDVFPALFKARIVPRVLMMATGEAISHLNYLIDRDEMTAEKDDDGVNWYRMRP